MNGRLVGKPRITACLSGRLASIRRTGALFTAAAIVVLLSFPSLAAAGPAGPPPPDGLSVFPRQEDLGLRVTVTWNHRPECAGYKVYRATNAEGPYEYIGGLSAETMDAFPFFLDDGAGGGGIYFYRVSALDTSWQEGPQSAPVEARTVRSRRAAAAGKSILVSLADQRAYFFENGVMVNILRCSTGAGGTPTGNFRILAHRGTVSGCPYWMDWKPNYGMHSWPSYLGGYEENLGVTPRSHGCIRLHPLEAHWPYYWAPDGTPLTIIGGAYGRLPLKGASCSQGAAELSRTWYFPEGYVDAEFLEYLALFNPGPEPVNALTTYYPEGHEPVTENYYLPPGIRFTVPVNGVSGIPHGYGHAIAVVADGPIVAQQSEYFNMANRRGGHTTTGATSAEKTWFFSEGYTGAFFSTYLILFNPGNKESTCRVNYSVSGGEPYVHHFTMPPRSRGTTLVNALPGLNGKEVSIEVESDVPLVAGRTVYFDWTGNPNYVNGGTATIGVASGSKTWYFAEGCTGHQFDEYILILNPQGSDATVNLEFCTASGPYVHRITVPAGSRSTVAVDSILPSVETGAIVTSDSEIVVERAMYTTRDSRRGGHVATGVSEPSQDWYFAEGFTGGTFDEYVVVMNPGTEPTTVEFLFHREDGGKVGAAFGIAPKSRFTLHVDAVRGLEWTGSAVEIHADRPVVAEQAHYFCIPR